MFLGYSVKRQMSPRLTVLHSGHQCKVPSFRKEHNRHSSKYSPKHKRLGDSLHFNRNRRGTLTCVDLSRNQIDVIHTKAFLKLVNLTELNLSHNKLTDINYLSNLHLVSLDLSYNKINPQKKKVLTSIKHLVIRGNNIADLSDLKSISQSFEKVHVSGYNIGIRSASDIYSVISSLPGILTLENCNLTTQSDDFETQPVKSPKSIPVYVYPAADECNDIAFNWFEFHVQRYAVGSHPIATGVVTAAISFILTLHKRIGLHGLLGGRGDNHPDLRVLKIHWSASQILKSTVQVGNNQRAGCLSYAESSYMMVIVIVASCVGVVIVVGICIGCYVKFRKRKYQRCRYDTPSRPQYEIPMNLLDPI
ncbi:hypothetical protein CAPTEDRAFT_192003 [Capitella teleta]|uniref:Uncharacterized protein n=1 Tax=Capitella teleta TaxID=283909 RepID=R7TGC3_CAPTE|nr:hypothetical protein CAPTEDRAFT_192003 [Capitella teleta]|eukprot:ELT90616.1 hypothetical protein CAPTEDRAFT_192003 [Capitella teleta]